MCTASNFRQFSVANQPDTHLKLEPKSFCSNATLLKSASHPIRWDAPNDSHFHTMLLDFMFLPCPLCVSLLNPLAPCSDDLRASPGCCST